MNMNISEAAKRTGLSSKMIRDYEQAGLISPAKRNPSGYRQYNEADLDALHFIKHAREVDFSLPQIKTLLDLKNNPNRSSADVKQLVGQHILELQQKINRLQSMSDSLQSWYQHCKGDTQPECPIIEGLSETPNTVQRLPEKPATTIKTAYSAPDKS